MRRLRLIPGFPLIVLLACSRPQLPKESPAATGYTITGRVLDSHGVRPLPSVAVMLVPRERVHGTLLLAQSDSLHPDPDYCRTWVKTDGAGRFRFDAVADPLAFVVRAQVTYTSSDWPDPWLFTDEPPGRGGNTEQVQQVELRLPPAGRLLGRLPMRANGYDTDWVVFASPHVRSPRAEGPMSERGLETAVGFEGRFEFRYLVTGDLDLVACRNWNDHPGSSLGTVTIRDGETLEREFTFDKGR